MNGHPVPCPAGAQTARFRSQERERFGCHYCDATFAQGDCPDEAIPCHDIQVNLKDDSLRRARWQQAQGEWEWRHVDSEVKP